MIWTDAIRNYDLAWHQFATFGDLLFANLIFVGTLADDYKTKVPLLFERSKIWTKRTRSGLLELPKQILRSMSRKHI